MEFMFDSDRNLKRESDTLDRFKRAQEGVYEQALQEIKNACKSGHWMWFIFPQMKGLGMTYNANYYGITDLEEAKAYLQDSVLGSRLIEISKALLSLEQVTMCEVMGGIDEMKLRSSMTLFSLASDNPVFDDVLKKYFGGEKDELTLNLVQ